MKILHNTVVIGYVEASFDDIPTKAIDMVDDMLAGLHKEAQYGEQGDILRYILTRLQGK